MCEEGQLLFISKSYHCCYFDFFLFCFVFEWVMINRTIFLFCCCCYGYWIVVNDMQFCFTSITSASTYFKLLVLLFLSNIIWNISFFQNVYCPGQFLILWSGPMKKDHTVLKYVILSVQGGKKLEIFLVFLKTT